MPVVVICPACERKARVPCASIGKSVKCPSCGISFQAQSAESASAIRAPAELVNEADAPRLPESPETEARQVTRRGVGLLAVSQGLLAGGTVLQLLMVLLRLITSDTSAKSPFQESFAEFVMVAGTLALLGGIIAALIGAVFCTVTPGAISLRAAAGAVLVLSVLHAIQTPTGSLRDLFAGTGRGNLRGADFPTQAFAGLMLLVTLTPEAFEAARQAMLALYARSQARRLGDRTATGLGGIVAIAYPAAVIGLLVLGIVVGLFSAKPHSTFDQVLQVLVLLAKSVLIALGGFVMLRVWLALGAVRG